MMLSRCLWGIMVSCTSVCKLSAQTSSNYDLTSPFQNYQPGSNASAMVKVDDVPVSYYTGKPQVSFPLYQIRSGGLVHDISLNYTGSGGIAVAEQGTWAGLGWDVTVGGVIARTVNGRPDELTGNPAGYTAAAGSLSLPLWTTPNAGDWMGTLTNCQKSDMADGRKDMLPDMFFASFGGQSAKLMYDHTGTLRFASYKPWKVVGNVFSGFTITIENGTRYEFKTMESTTTDVETLPGDGGSVFTCNSAWFLTRIVSATLKDTIAFNYTPATFTNADELPSETMYTPYTGQTSGCNGAGVGNEQLTKTYTSQTINTHMLSSIVYRSGKVEFSAPIDRADITNGNRFRLRDIKLFSAKGLTYTQFKTIRLNHSYSNSTATNPLLKRMFLTSFSEVADTDSLTHTFGYDDVDGLPAKNSMAQDHWGYYNGAGGNTSLIPEINDPYSTSFPGANREPNASAMKKGLLASITYPTGGTVSFEYEPHFYSYEGNSSIYKPAGIDSIPRDTFTTATTYGSHPSIYRDTTVVYVPDLGTGLQATTITYSIQGQISGDPQASVQLYDHNWNLLTGMGNTTTGTTVNWPLTANRTYYLVAERVGTTEKSMIRLNYKYYNKFYRPAIYGQMAGGTRIKRIIKYDGINHANDQVTMFSYTLNDSISSGVLLHVPKYRSLTKKPYYCTFTPGGTLKGGDWLYDTRYGSSTTPLGRTQGSPIGYSKVRVFMGENGENGYQDMSYTINGLADSGGNGYPFTPKTSRDELRGLMLSSRVYDNQNRRLRSTTNEYALNNTAGSPNLRWIWGAKYGASTVSNTYTTGGCPDNAWSFTGGMYQLFQFWPVMKATTDSVFDVNNGTFLAQKTTFTYDSVTAQITKKEVTGTNVVTTTYLFSYAKDFPGTATMDSMVARNIQNEVVDGIVQHAGVQISREKTNYGFVNGMLAPLSKSMVRANEPLETRLYLYGYDSRGNLLEQGKSDDLHQVYLWGYNYEYPVAEITGATYAQVIGLVDTTVLRNPLNDAAIRTEVNKIRTALAGSSAQVKTMTYSSYGLVTSMTDAAGTITYYEFDGLGRLVSIKDHQGMVLKHFSYKYQRPVTE